MKLFLLTLIGTTGSAFALWEQCGGKNWAGTTTCAAGETCYAQNEFYSQCISSTQATAVVDNTPAVTVTAAAAAATTSGVQIRGVSSPVYHLYLQSLSGVPVLGPEASGGRFVISGSIQLLGTTPLYLNVANNSTSYKTLTFDATPSFNGWALEGDTIITAQSSSFGRQLNFLACPSGTSGYYRMYLQTGNDTPGSGCSMQTIHLPCLC